MPTLAAGTALTFCHMVMTAALTGSQTASMRRRWRSPLGQRRKLLPVSDDARIGAPPPLDHLPGGVLGDTGLRGQRAGATAVIGTERGPLGNVRCSKVKCSSVPDRGCCHSRRP